MGKGAEEERLKGKEFLRKYWYFTHCNTCLSGRWESDSCPCVFPCIGVGVYI